MVDVIADKTASIFCRKVEIVPGTHGGIPAKTDNDRQHAGNRAGIILHEARANDIPLKKEIGVERSRETARISRRKFRQGLPDNSATRHFVSDPVSRFVVALSRE